MQIVCPKCNTNNTEAARYCNACGVRLGVLLPASNSARRVELRQVTVLFCDVVGSTELSNSLDPEDQALVYSGFRDIVRKLTRLHSGYRLRFDGDGARAIFGHPESREDASESAVRCGLSLATAIRAIRPAHGESIELRVGIAFGTAVLREEIDETADTDEAVVGSVPALAVRLAREAPPGGVVIDHATRRLVGRFFECRDMGRLRLKGFNTEVRGWRVISATAVVSRHEARRTAEHGERLVARQEELALLSQAWRRARDSQGSTVLLSGEPGVGKSRLTSALDLQVRAEGAACLQLDCTPRTQNTPLYPLSILARRLAGITPADTEAQCAERARVLLARWLEPDQYEAALPYLEPLFTPLTLIPVAIESGELVRERTIHFILELVHSLAKRDPLLVIVEDLHWSDPTTGALIARLAAGLQGWPLLLLVTARPEAGLPEATQHIVLPVLDAQASRELVIHYAEGDSLSPDVLEWILARGEGVPLYLEETTRSVLEGDTHPHRAEMNGHVRERAPALLQNLIQTRIDRRPELRGITQAAAVIGREFSLQLLERVTGLAPQNIHATVARLIDDGMLDGLQRADGGLRFKHALIQSEVYETLLRSDRERLHSRVADALTEDGASGIEAAPDVLAFHLRAAQRFEEAGRCLVRAGAGTIARAAYLEAVGHCNTGLELAGDIRDKDSQRRLRRQLLVNLGVAQTALRGYTAPEVVEAYRKARELCDDDDPADVYPVIRGIATHHLVRGELETAHRLSAQGMALAERAARIDFQIDALCVRAYTSLYFADLSECRAYLVECLRRYDEADGQRFNYPVPQDAKTSALALLPTVAWLLGDARGAEDAIRAGVVHVERLARPFDSALMHAWIAGTRFTQRRYALAAQHAQHAFDTSQRYGFTEWLGTGHIMGCLSRAVLGASVEALAEAQKSMAAFAARGVGLNASYYLWGLAQGLTRVGDATSARAMVQLAFDSAAASRETRMNAELLLLRAELEPDAALAREQIMQALALAEAQGAVATALRAALRLMMRYGAAAQERELARELLAALDDGRCEAEPAWMFARLGECRQWIDRAQMAAGATC